MSYPECKECKGWCCRELIHKVEAHKVTDLVKEFYAARALRWHMDDEDNMICYLDQPCPHLIKKSGRCRIYKDRPEVCKRYPEEEWSEYMEDYCPVMKRIFS
jgi:Fe-S-cluster containining protein